MSLLLSRLADYVDAFEREFSSAVAEERYVQLIRPLWGRPSWPPDERALDWHEGKGGYPRTGLVHDRRQLLSDVALVHTSQGWVGHRDVATVNGSAVRGRPERLSKLFLSPDAAGRADQLRRIAEDSARYNLGGFVRTLNVPTLPLSYLRGSNHGRFSFAAAGRDRIRDRDADVLRYDERRRPTLIGTPAGEDVRVSGRVWLDAESGAVLQTEIRMVIGQRRGEIVTRYRPEPGFEVLAPDYMWEWYDGPLIAGIGGGRTVVECLARYSGYRRFAVTTEVH